MRRGQRWYYNRAFPKDVQEILGKDAFRRSLRTESLEEARRARPEAERLYFAAVDSARAARAEGRPDTPNETIAQSLVVEWFRCDIVEAERSLPEVANSQHELDEALAQTADHIADMRRALAEEGGDHRARKIANEIAEAAGFSRGGPALVRLVQRARIASAEVFCARLVSDYGKRPGDPLFAAALEAPRVASTAERPAEPQRTLNDLITAFKEARWDEMKPAGRAGYELAFRTLLDTLGGDKAIATVTRQEAREVFEIVKALPKGYGKGPKWEGLDTRAAVAKADREGLPRIAPATINKTHMGMIASLFGWAEREGWIVANRFKGLRVKDPVPDRDKRDSLAADQLAKLFGAEPWRPRDASPQGRPSRYWFPLLALFQGMRLSEIAQLRPVDFRQEDGVRLFEVRGELKNANARRTLPMHPELARLGLLDLVSERRKAGKEYLFDEGPDPRGKWGVTVGRWFGRQLEERKLTGNRLGLHSLRHAFEDALRRAELHQTPLGATLAGRRLPDPVAGAYGRGFSPRQLADAIAKVQYPGLPELPAKR
jgi:integrase